MGFKEWSSRLLSRLSGQEEDRQEPNLSNGGTSGYRPGSKDVMGSSSMRPEDLNNGAGQGDDWQRGWGGADPTGAQSGYQQSGYVNPPQQPYGTMGAQSGYQQSGYVNPPQQPYGTMGAQSGYQQAYGTSGAPQNGYQPPMGQQPQQPDPQTPDNITYMNNQFCNDNGTASCHVERLTAVFTLAGCYRLIEFLRNMESVIVNMEGIADTAEVQRALDILAGAAFTLNCSMTRITENGRVYLLAPNTVTVMRDEHLPDAVMYRRAETEQPEEQPEEQPVQRSRSYSGPRYQAR